MKPENPGTLAEGLAYLGFRSERTAIEAFLTHAHKSRLGPTETLEQLIVLERRSRETTNLARRTRAAYLGKFKTMIAKNLGLLALQAGYSVRFNTLAGALGDLLKQESIPAFERRMKRYTRPELLILDELGYLPCDSRAADILYNIINRRHEERSIVITTNLSFKQWSGVFPGAACVVALVDRFSQHCHKVDIEADSWRDTHPFDRDGA